MSRIAQDRGAFARGAAQQSVQFRTARVPRNGGASEGIADCDGATHTGLSDPCQAWRNSGRQNHMAALDGTIKRLVSDKGFGFILASDGN